MKPQTRWTSFAGVGALALIMIAGCSSSDQTGEGQTGESPDTAKVQNGVDKIKEGAKEAGGAAANIAAKSGEKAANAASNAAANLGAAASNVAANAGNAAANAASTAGKTVANVATKAGQATDNAATKITSSAKSLDEAAIITPKVKTAIMADAALKGSQVDVSTTDKDISLDGTVKSEAQKATAGKIAAKTATGYTIKNNLKVAY